MFGRRSPVWAAATGPMLGSIGSAKAATTPASAEASIAKTMIPTMINLCRRRRRASRLSVTHSTTTQFGNRFPERTGFEGRQQGQPPERPSPRRA